jgi:hypothetical protein
MSAVTMAVITVSTDNDLSRATATKVKTARRVHWQPMAAGAEFKPKGYVPET